MIVDACTTLGGELSVSSLLRSMDDSGIARAVIGPMADELAVHNAAGNDRLLAEARRCGGRLIPTCTATPWRGDEAVQIVRGAASRGARLLVLAPALQGFNLADDLADPLLRLAGELALPVYVHTGPHSLGAPTQVVLAAQRHPATRFILGHCGSTDHAWDMLAIAREHMSDNLYLESSQVRPWAMPRYIELAGPSRVLFGSAMPVNDQRFELRQFMAQVPLESHAGFYGSNLLALLGEENKPC